MVGKYVWPNVVFRLKFVKLGIIFHLRESANVCNNHSLKGR